MLSEGKAMELFRKLREKPRGLDFHASVYFYLTLHGVFIWEYIFRFFFSFSDLPFPSQTKGVQGTDRRWCVWWFRPCSSMRESSETSTTTLGIHSLNPDISSQIA